MSRECYCDDKHKYSYDYEKQVWIIDGVYSDCGHDPNLDGAIKLNQEKA